MSLEGELELIQTIKKYNLRYEHRLEQRKITDYFCDIDARAINECQYYLRKNRMLPRLKATKQIDLLVWKEPHWAALAIEEKSQEGARKSLNIYKDNIVLNTDYGYGSKIITNFGRDLYLQCLGESYLGKAYLTAQNADYKVIPVAAVDYDLQVNATIGAGWVYNQGIFFVNKRYFEWFLGEYSDDARWIRRIYEKSPKIFYDSAA